MGDNKAGELPEAEWSYQVISHDDLLAVLENGEISVKLYSSKGEELTPLEFSAAYLAPGSNEVPEAFRAHIDDEWVLYVRPKTDLETVISWVAKDLWKVFEKGIRRTAK